MLSCRTRRWITQQTASQPASVKPRIRAGIRTEQPIQTVCVSCGASIPAEQRKCRFCLEHKLDDVSESDAGDTEQTLRGVIQFLVEAGTFYAAVAKGAAAASLLTSAPDEPFDDCTLIYDLKDEPAPQITERWPTLPAATEVTSAAGGALPSAARDRTAWEEMGEAIALRRRYHASTTSVGRGFVMSRPSNTLSTAAISCGSSQQSLLK